MKKGKKCGSLFTGKAPDDWRNPFIKYLQDQSQKVERRINFLALNCMLLEDQLHRKWFDRQLLRCLEKEEAEEVST